METSNVRYYPKEIVPKYWKACHCCGKYPDTLYYSYRKWWHLFKTAYCPKCAGAKNYEERFKQDNRPSEGSYVEFNGGRHNAYSGMRGVVHHYKSDVTHYCIFTGISWLTNIEAR